MKTNQQLNLPKNVEASLQMNTVCPFDLKLVNTNVILTYLLSVKRENYTILSFSHYDGK